MLLDHIHADLRRRLLDEDMNKIMMAVLQALQDEKERHEQQAADEDPHPA